MPPGKKPHILVAGAGALGSLFGGLLAERGLPVTLFTRRTEHIAAIRQNGLRIIGEGGDRNIRVGATQLPHEIPPVDLALILGKSTATKEICAQILPAFHHHTVALSFQNGLGNEEIMAEIFGTERVLGGLTAMGATLEAPGIVRNYATLPSTIGELSGNVSERVHAIAGLFTEHGLPTEATATIQEAKWQKLLMNVAMSATSGLTGLTIGEIAASPHLAVIARRAMDEAASVAEATGIHLDPAIRYKVFDEIVHSGAARNKTSMRRDIEAGRITEVTAIYGSVINRARAAGIAVPTLESFSALISGLEQASLKKERN